MLTLNDVSLERTCLVHAQWLIRHSPLNPQKENKRLFPNFSYAIDKMCIPDRPSPDWCDDNEQVPAHFSKTPGLTPLPRTHRYRAGNSTSVVDCVKREVGRLYEQHHVSKCPRYGLFWAGSRYWSELRERSKTLLLVIELAEQDIRKWWMLDGEVRGILSKYGLDGGRGVCARYYQYRDEKEEEAMEEAIRQSNPRQSEQSSDSLALRPSINGSPAHLCSDRVE